MVFNNQPQPMVQNPHPYIEMWKKIKLEHKYSKVFLRYWKKTLIDDFFTLGEKSHFSTMFSTISQLSFIVENITFNCKMFFAIQK